MAIEIGPGITIGSGIFIGNTIPEVNYIATQDNNLLVTQSGDNLITEN